MRTIIIGLLLVLTGNTASADQPSVKNLLDSPLNAIKSHNVIMSKLNAPANTALPRHYHPSEEFLYVISGETTLKIDGQADLILKSGMAHKIPAEAVHSAATGNARSEIIVFRVHPKGQTVVMKPKD